MRDEKGQKRDEKGPKGALGDTSKIWQTFGAARFKSFRGVKYTKD